MARPMSYAMAAALKARAPLALFAEIEHPDGTARLWSGIGTISYNGYDWIGSGKLGSVTPIKQSTDIAIQEIEFRLAGADPEIVAQLSDDVRNRAGRLFLAALDDNMNVIADPMQIVDSQLDFQSQRIDDGGTAIVSITARSGFYTLERALDDVWSSEDQKSRFPDDSGLDLISKLQNQDIIWGPA
jgi:hypothetical protein